MLFSSNYEWLLEMYMLVNEGTLKVHYDGDNEHLIQHQMNAKLVSKSINAVDVLYCEAFKEINKIYKHKVETEVFIEGGFQEGSLWWLCKIFGIEREQQQDTNDKSSYSLVSVAIERVISLLKLIPIEQVEIIITETIEGYELIVENEKVVINELECAFLTNEKIRGAISDLASPLNENGIDTLTISDFSHSENTIKVSNLDKHNLIVKRKHKQIVETGTICGLFYVEDLSYNPHSKWKLISESNPSYSINAVITDPTFLKAVADNKEKFSKDDLLNIQGTWYKEKAKLTGKITSTYTIIEVKEHVKYEERQWKLL